MRFAVLLSVYVGLCLPASAHKLVKIKFRDSRGNVIYYTAQDHSDVFFYCDLYFIPAGASTAQKVVVTSSRMETTDDLGGEMSYCIPVKVKIRGAIYRCRLGPSDNDIYLTSSSGAVTRFRSIE